MPDGYVLIRFAFGIEKGDDGRVHPVNASIFRTIAKLTLPDLAGSDRSPEFAYEFLGVITGIDDAVVLTQQLFTASLHQLGEGADYIEVAKVIAALNGTEWEEE